MLTVCDGQSTVGFFFSDKIVFSDMVRPGFYIWVLFVRFLITTNASLQAFHN